MILHNGFDFSKVDCRGLGKAAAHKKRMIAYNAWLISCGCDNLFRDETNRNERNAAKVRRFEAKVRNI